MSYLVFARKYRPQTFDQVVQQNHVTRTLRNAIKAQRVAHAILFSGPRGTGKTTVARILAKAMNCAQGPTAEPCNQCTSCVEITAGNAADVFEIDGASNNSVDQVRELRENLKYMPVHSRYKIYIIDEVHMLSIAAFNALLKTLEEPPEHILFMFATTEVQKIPITILSRCQRHDLRRIDNQSIADHLRKICEAENVVVDDAGLNLIAQESGGSMRDSLSLMDHVLACAEGPVSVQLIGELLGIIERKHLFDLSAAVFQRDLSKVLASIDTVWRHGYEIKRFYVDLVAHFHQLTLAKLEPQVASLIDLPSHEIARMQSQVAEVSEHYLLQIFDMLFQAEPTIKLSSQPKLGLEMVFLKLFQVTPSLPIHTLIDRLDQFHKRIEISAPPSVQSEEQEHSPVLNKVNQAIDHVAEQVDNKKELIELTEKNKTDAVTESSVSVRQEVDAAPQDLPALWQKVLGQVAVQKPSLAGFLTKCKLLSHQAGKLTLEVNGNAFTLKNIKKNTQVLESICSEQLRQSVTLKIEANIEDADVKMEQKEKAGRLRQKAMSHPLVMTAMELFDGRLIDIKIPKEV